MTDFLSRIGQFVRSHTPVQRSKSQENEQPMEKRAAGKRSHSLASRSSVKSLKSRMVSIGSPKKIQNRARQTNPNWILQPHCS